MLLQTLPSRLKMVLFPTFTASAARRSAQLKNKVVQRQLAKWFSRRAPFFTALLWRFHHKTFGPFASKGKKTPAEALEAAMAFKGQQGQSQNQKKEHKPKWWDTDSDGDGIPPCTQCYLPVGELAHPGMQANTCVHAECMAQVIAQAGQLAEEHQLKSRFEFGIG